jgi:membrane-associated phospholipid phosphatase
VTLSALDRGTVGYLAFAAAALGLARPRPASAPLLLAGYALLAVLALLAPRLRRRGGAAGFLGEFYPLMATVLLYTAIGLVNTARGVSHDATVQAWEQALFGTQPSRAWIRAAPWPWLSTLMHAGYLSYYFILAGAPLALWTTGRREGARRVTLAVMAAFYACYAVFHLFPVAGPRYFFPRADNAATQAALARAVQSLLDGGAAWGTAFPSSHVAASLAAAGAALREWPALGSVLLPAAAVLTLGTVYGQLHYAVDAAAGALVAASLLAITRPRKMGR